MLLHGSLPLSSFLINVYLTCVFLVFGIRFLILDQLKVPLAHFKYVMFKYLEVSSYILVRLMVVVAEFPWVIKLFAR